MVERAIREGDHLLLALGQPCEVLARVIGECTVAIECDGSLAGHVDELKFQRRWIVIIVDVVRGERPGYACIRIGRGTAVLCCRSVVRPANNQRGGLDACRDTVFIGRAIRERNFFRRAIAEMLEGQTGAEGERTIAIVHQCSGAIRQSAHDRIHEDGPVIGITRAFKRDGRGSVLRHFRIRNRHCSRGIVAAGDGQCDGRIRVPAQAIGYRVGEAVLRSFAGR
jgi:hypothetical protein